MEPVPVGSVWRHPVIALVLTVSRNNGNTVWYKFNGEDVAVPVNYWLDCVAQYGLVRVG